MPYSRNKKCFTKYPYYDYYDLKTRALSAEYLIKMQSCFVTLSAIHYNNKHTLSKLEELKLSNCLSKP